MTKKKSDVECAYEGPVGGDLTDGDSEGKLRAELEKLMSENAGELRVISDEKAELAQQNVRLAAENAALRDRVEKLRSALEPFRFPAVKMSDSLEATFNAQIPDQWVVRARMVW